MSRRMANEEEILSALIDNYKVKKDAESSLKKDITLMNDDIKYYMNKLNKDSFSTDKWTATITVTHKESLDEYKAIEILKANLSEDMIDEVVKTKEYIDDDALEKLIYNNQFDPSLLASCTVKGKEVSTLRINKKK